MTTQAPDRYNEIVGNDWRLSTFDGRVRAKQMATVLEVKLRWNKRFGKTNPFRHEIYGPAKALEQAEDSRSAELAKSDFTELQKEAVPKDTDLPFITDIFRSRRKRKAYQHAILAR